MVFTKSAFHLEARYILIFYFLDLPFYIFYPIDILRHYLTSIAEKQNVKLLESEHFFFFHELFPKDYLRFEHSFGTEKVCYIGVKMLCTH